MRPWFRTVPSPSTKTNCNQYTKHKISQTFPSLLILSHLETTVTELTESILRTILSVSFLLFVLRTILKPLPYNVSASQVKPLNNLRGRLTSTSLLSRVVLGVAELHPPQLSPPSLEAPDRSPMIAYQRRDLVRDKRHQR